MTLKKELSERERSLLLQARRAAENAYCPYSKFAVGAAVETDAGIFLGCNIENASYGLTICAERTAVFNAISTGAKSILMVAVSCQGSDQKLTDSGSVMPCGACRQTLAEFMPPEGPVIIDGAGVWTVAELLPAAFRLFDISSTGDGS